MAVSPQLLALLKKMGQDDLNDLAVALVPAIVEEIELLSPAGAQATETAIFTVLMPTIQAAVASLIAKVEL